MNAENQLITVGFGLILGVIRGLFDAGGRLMFLLLLLGILKYPPRLVVRTSSLIITMTAVLDIVGYDLKVTLTMLLGSSSQLQPY